MVTWHLTVKLFPAKCHEWATLRKLWRQTGNSSLLPANCCPLFHVIRGGLMLSLESQRVFQNLLLFLFCYISNHSMTGPFGNSEFCFPRVSMFPRIRLGKHWDSWETKSTVPLGTSHQVLSILFHTSRHPREVKQSIPHAQALRLRHICAASAAFEHRAADLRKNLVNRGYKEKIVGEQMHRVRVLDWEELLLPRQETTNKRSPVVFTYHPGLPNIGGILRELHPLLHFSNRCKQAIKYLPMMTIWFVLSYDHTRGTHKCASNRYDVYNYLIVGDRFSSHTSGTSYNINRSLSWL